MGIFSRKEKILRSLSRRFTSEFPTNFNLWKQFPNRFENISRNDSTWEFFPERKRPRDLFQNDSLQSFPQISIFENNFQTDSKIFLETIPRGNFFQKEKDLEISSTSDFPTNLRILFDRTTSTSNFSTNLCTDCSLLSVSITKRSRKQNHGRYNRLCLGDNWLSLNSRGRKVPVN